MNAAATSSVGETHPVSRSLVQKAVRLAARVLAALGLVAAITFVLFRVLSVNATTTGFVYLVAILMIAAAGGLVESIIASVVATLCFNYFFLPPIETFTIADPQNLVALFSFLVTSLTVSQLSAWAKRRTKEAIARQHELERLYSLSRALLLADPSRPMANQIVRNIAQIFEFPVALYDRASNEIYRAAGKDLPHIDTKLIDAALESASFGDVHAEVIIRPIRLSGQLIGSIAIRSPSLSDAALESLLNLVVIGLERAMSQEALNRAEVARRGGELKSTLLDAIAHEFKTPLTSIKAVTTDLLSEPTGELLQHQRELVAIADEGTDRLSKLVTEAIQLARIEGGTFQLNRGMHFPRGLVSEALRQLKSLTNEREISVSVADDLPPVWVDAELIQMVITHLLENALKYSPSGSPISINAHSGGARVVISVTDKGPGMTEEEQSRIFERFYRGKKELNPKGSGMGLAIAREIMNAHEGEIWVSSKFGKGSEFSLSLSTLAGREDD